MIMSLSLIDRFTPRVFPRTRLLTAAHVWSGVGTFLSIKGVVLSAHASPRVLAIALASGIVLGLLKGRLVFDRVAEKIISHIRQKPSRACLGGLFSVKNWGLIIMMMLFGRVVGTSTLDQSLKTGIYVMVGTGLVYSSRRLWTAWKKTSPIALQDLRR